MEISIVVPVYNDEHNLHELKNRIFEQVSVLATSFELIFINDFSKDTSIDVIKELCTSNNNIEYIDFSRNFGQQIAITAGLAKAKGKYIVIMDSDLQDPPELIPKLYDKIKEGYEVVYAKRADRKGENFFKKSSAHLFYRLINKLTNVDLPVDVGEFRIIHKKVAKVLLQMPEREKYLRGQIAWIGFKQTHVLFNREKRHSGSSNYSIWALFKMAMNGITSFSNFPLKLASFIGFTVSLVAFVLMLYTLYSRFITGNYVPGWASLMMSVLFIGGIQLISIGIIGEYIGRMSENIRQRPLYIIKESSYELDEESD